MTMLTVIIPAYNERNLVLQVIDRVLSSDTSPFAKEIIVVDDGSTDGTGEVLRPLYEKGLFRLITIPENRGKTFAIRIALREAKGDIVLIQDADLEYSPSDYRKLLEPFREDAVQAVYGSRFLNRRWPANMKPLYWFANRTFTFVTNLLYDARITDEGTAYKVFRREVLQEIDITGSGFEFCPEVTAKLLLRGIRIVDVPISYLARDRKEGKKPLFIDGVRILWALVKYRFSRG